MKKRRWRVVAAAIVAALLLVVFILFAIPSSMFARDFQRTARANGLERTDQKGWMYSTNGLSVEQGKRLESDMAQLAARHGLFVLGGWTNEEGCNQEFRGAAWDGKQLKVSWSRGSYAVVEIDDERSAPWQPITDWLRSLTGP